MKQNNFEPLVYIESSYHPKNIFLDSITYGKALDSLVIACIDVAVIYEDRILLGKRKHYPQKDWWLVGGRLKAGESPQECSSRHILDTLGLQINPNDCRYEYVLSFYGAWAKRAHKPYLNGTHTHSSIYSLIITGLEKDRINVCGEFSDIQWLNMQDVMSGDFHDLIKKATTKIFGSY
jgi:ADP-ribose pyrophosphatase YjhB (NUDIX family)